MYHLIVIYLDTARWKSILYELIPCINKVLLLLLLLFVVYPLNFKYVKPADGEN